MEIIHKDPTISNARALYALTPEQRGIIIEIEKMWFRFVPIKEGWFSQVMRPKKKTGSQEEEYTLDEGIKGICILLDIDFALRIN